MTPSANSFDLQPAVYRPSVDDELARQVEWAKAEAARLRTITRWINESPMAPARDFLATVAPGSSFLQAAQRDLLEYSDEGGATADALDEWARYVETGMANAVPYGKRFRIDAATDLMQQVHVLLDDAAVHPAVSVMVAGAALEEMLRSLFQETAEQIIGNPGLEKYGAALKKAGVITKEQAHQVTSMAATRNDAAHGNFDAVTRESARLFVDRVNFFITQHAGR